MRDVPDDAITSEELRILVERGSEQGTIEAEEEQMIGGVLELGERRVHEVMVARVDIVALPVEASLDEIVQTIVAGGHSRIPVYDGSIDNVVGLLYAKDLLPFLVGDDRPPSIRGLVRTPLFVPESMLVDDLLHSLQRASRPHGHRARRARRHGRPRLHRGPHRGDRGRDPGRVRRGGALMIVPLGEDEARVDGRADVDDLLEHFDATLEGDDQEEFDTVGGLVYHYVGGVPKVGDTVTVAGLRLTVEATDGRRVRTVHVARIVPTRPSGTRGRLTRLGADGRSHDLVEALDGVAVHERHRGDLGEGVVAMLARPAARELVGTDALEDEPRLLDVRLSRPARPTGPG